MNNSFWVRSFQWINWSSSQNWSEWFVSECYWFGSRVQLTNSSIQLQWLKAHWWRKWSLNYHLKFRYMFGTDQHETSTLLSSMVVAESCSGVLFCQREAKKLVAIKGNTWSQNPRRVPVSASQRPVQSSDPFVPVQQCSKELRLESNQKFEKIWIYSKFAFRNMELYTELCPVKM